MAFTCYGVHQFWVSPISVGICGHTLGSDHWDSFNTCQICQLIGLGHGSCPLDVVLAYNKFAKGSAHAQIPMILCIITAWYMTGYYLAISISYLFSLEIFNYV